MPTPSDCYDAHDACVNISLFQLCMLISNRRVNTLPESITALTGKWCLLVSSLWKSDSKLKEMSLCNEQGQNKTLKMENNIFTFIRLLLCSEHHTLGVTEATAPAIFSPAAEWTMGRMVTETLSELRWPAVSVTVSWKIYPPSWMWDSFSVPGCGTWGKARSKKKRIGTMMHAWPSRNKMKCLLQSNQPIQSCISACNIWFFFFCFASVCKKTHNVQVGLSWSTQLPGAVNLRG